MACGTGKTLVALWVAEQVAQELVGRAIPCPPPPANEDVLVHPGGAHGVTRPTAAARILILLPSLALLRQTLHEWLRETRLPSLAYHCVCSDTTVKEGIDALTAQQT
jgi:predicted helicase